MADIRKYIKELEKEQAELQKRLSQIGRALEALVEITAEVPQRTRKAAAKTGAKKESKPERISGYTRSPQTRARMAAAQRRRWENKKASERAGKPPQGLSRGSGHPKLVKNDQTSQELSSGPESGEKVPGWVTGKKN